MRQIQKLKKRSDKNNVVIAINYTSTGNFIDDVYDMENRIIILNSERLWKLSNQIDVLSEPINKVLQSRYNVNSALRSGYSVRDSQIV